MSVNELTRAIPLEGSKLKTDEDASGRHSQAIWFPGAVDDVKYITPGAAPEDSAIAFVGAADLVYLDVLINDAELNERWLMMFDAITLPTNGASPDRRWTIPAAGSSGTRQRIIEPMRVIETVALGIVVALSSTPGLLTVTTGSEGWFAVRGKDLS